MSSVRHTASPSWAIVVGDDHGYESGLPTSGQEAFAPVQYCLLNGRRPLFHDALRRALRIAPISQVLVTAQDACRFYWEQALWCIRPEHRFISMQSGLSWLTTASAILTIAYKSPHSIVTLLPGGCYVSHEATLTDALDRAVALLPLVPEGVISLGMQDLDGGVDEDYLVPPRGERELLQPLLGVARRPLTWIAQYLRAEGALVASRVTCGYARTLAAHIALVWPGLAPRLLERALTVPARAEGGVRIGVPKDLPKALVRARNWYPPALPQRALRVTACGWSGLRTPRAVARLSAFLTPELHDLPLAAMRRSKAIRVPASIPDRA